MPLSVIAHLTAITLLALIAVVDWHKRQIWHLLTLSGTILAIALAPLLPARFHLNALVAALIGFTLFYTIWLLATRHYGNGAFGFGDVMLALLIGAIGGINGLLWLAIGMLLAGGYAAWLRHHQAPPEQPFAYGTFLALAALGGVAIRLRVVL